MGSKVTYRSKVGSKVGSEVGMSKKIPLSLVSTRMKRPGIGRPVKPGARVAPPKDDLEKLLFHAQRKHAATRISAAFRGDRARKKAFVDSVLARFAHVKPPARQMPNLLQQMR